MLVRCVFSLVLAGCVVPLARAEGKAECFELETLRNIPYLEDDGADPVRHKLDIHRPKGCKNYPVLFFVHGGGWVQGHKDQLGMYSLLARTLSRLGIGMVCPNYRLSPEVKHPGHIRDVARAFAWTHANIAKYGGDPSLIFVGGHSAGGHLSALLATDETYLKEVGLSLANIQGAIPVSGVFDIPDLRVFDPVFGKDATGRRRASPISHVGDRKPPFLILYGDNDIPSCDRPGAEAFFQALKKNACQAQICEIEHRNHLSILWNAALRETDPATRNMLSFIMSRVIAERLTRNTTAAVDDLTDFIARFTANVGK